MFWILMISFILFSILINTYPTITLWDRSLILYVQKLLIIVPNSIPIAFDGILYLLMLIIPIIFSSVYFIIKKKYFDIIYLSLIPLITYAISGSLKLIVERPRPPIEMHLLANQEGFSFVSNHTVITFCLWGMIVYYLINYCQNKFFRYIGFSIAILWSILIGFSRIWLGVHNPTDVIAAFLLGALLLIIYIRIREFIEKYIGL